MDTIGKVRRGRPRLKRLKRLNEDQENNIINSAIDKILFRNSIAKTVEMSAEQMLTVLNPIRREAPRTWSQNRQSLQTQKNKDLEKIKLTNQSHNNPGASTSKTEAEKRKNMETNLPRKIKTKTSNVGKGMKRSAADNKASKGLGASNKKSGVKMARKNSTENKSIRKQNREEKLRKQIGAKKGNVGVVDNEDLNNQANEAVKVEKLKSKVKKSPIKNKEFLKKGSLSSRNDVTNEKKNENEKQEVVKTNLGLKKKLSPLIKTEKESVKQVSTNPSLKSVQILADKRKSLKDLTVSSEGWQRCGVKLCDKFRYVEDKKHGEWLCSRHKEAEVTHPAVFRVGSVVTASFKAGQAPWAGIVDFCPDTEMWAWPKSEKIEVCDEGYLGWFHVTFFTDPVTRAWVTAARVHLYSVGQKLKPLKASKRKSATNSDGSTTKKINLEDAEKMVTNNNAEIPALATRSKVLEASTNSKGGKTRKMQMTQEIVDRAMSMDRKDRLKKFSFINNYKGSWKFNQK